MITDYNQNKCKYTYDKLKKVIYLVSEDHVKNIYCEGYNGHIDGLTQLPLRLNGFDIRFNEETSLDERYLFQKTVTLSMHGYVDKTVFGGRFYVILESMDGTFWMVNVDFPSRVTYTFNLSNNTYQTDFTLTSYSNFPTLRLDENFEAVAPPCLGFNTFGVESLKLIERDYADLDTGDMTVTTYGTTFKDVEFMGDSCSFQSQFDGFKCTDTLSFNIPFDAYKSSWQYNLLEFTQNRYAAIIKPKSSENTIFAGFHFGLEPNYTIQTSDNSGESDVITINMVEMSDNGMTAALRWSDEQITETRWVWVRKVGEIICWECVGKGKARYLVQREVLANGLSTGRYKVLDGYEDEYSMLNVVGTFDETQLFDNNACGGGSCNMETDIPLNISFDSTGCSSYTFSSECDWNVRNLNVNWLTVSPMSGTGGNSYTIQVCNSTTDVDSTWFTIETDGGVRTVNVSVNDSSAFLRPSYVNIDCLSQTVNFAYSPSCPITIIGHDDRTTYQIANGRLVIQVPRNSTTSTTTYNYTARDCNGVTQTVHIYQDKTYERWVNTGNYLCESGNSYQEQARYTGTTQATTNTLTGERRAGELIESGDTRCSDFITKWEYNSSYTICIDGDEWSVEEEYISYDNGSTWNLTGNIRPLELVQSGSTICEETPTYEWRLTDKWVCESTTPTDYSTQYLTIESLEDNNTIKWSNGYEPDAKTISVSTDDGETWTAYTSTSGGTSIASLNTGQKVLLKGLNYNYHINSFGSTGQFKVYGNIMSLISGDTFENVDTLTNIRSFSCLFSGATGLTSAENLILPATTLTQSCYYNMFRGCTSLTVAPALPATTLALYCYDSMFDSCTSLTTAPVLPATSLASQCYYYMFYNCTSLNSITCLATDISATGCTQGWVSGVAASGTFVKASSMTGWTTGANGIPNNWNVLNE